MSEVISDLLGLINSLSESECAAALDMLRAAGLANTRGKMTVKEFAIEEIMRPHCCANCEFNFREQGCACGDDTDGHAYGHKIENANDICRAWRPSFNSWNKAVDRLHE